MATKRDKFEQDVSYMTAKDVIKRRQA